MSATVVLQVGPSRQACGGISAVLRLYEALHLGGDYDIRFVSSWDEGSRARAMLVFIRSLWRLRHECAQPGRPIVHVHMASRGSFVRKAIILEVAHRYGCPTVLHLHGGRFDRFAASGTRVRRWFIKRVFGNATAVLVLSKEWSSRVASFSGRSDAVVMPNPVIVPETTARGSDPPQILFLGRLCEGKGTGVLIEAVSLLQEAGVAAQYVIAGDGDASSYVTAARSLPDASAVGFPGWLDDEAKVAALESSDVFCLPSRDEGVPIALLEAMSWGIACVVTPVGGVPSVIRDGQNGLMVPVDDASRLAQALQRVVADVELRKRLATSARATVSREHGIDVVSAALSNLYAQLLRGAHATP